MNSIQAVLPARQDTSGPRWPGAGLLRLFPVQWALWWLIVPNLMIIAMWPVGGPGMAFSMCMCGIAALVAAHLRSLRVRRIAIFLIIVFTVLKYIAYSFNLESVALFYSLDLATELNPTASPEYVVAGIVLLVSMGLAVRFAPHVPRMGSWRERLCALALVGLLMAADTVATAGTRGSYKASAPAGTPIDSAMLQNRIAPGTVTANNLVVILVEALGVPANAEDRALFDQAWGSARWSSRYAVSEGTSVYYGSTTNAELREWCGVWNDHIGFDFATAHCLPQEFARAGFSTTSVHSFFGGFFDRETWYPKIGFQQSLFAPDLFRMKAAKCGGVFTGACDRDVPRVIGDLLRQDPGKRKLVYWLTLNAHLPVPADESLGTKDCKMGSAGWNRDYPMLCRNYLLQQRVADALNAELMKADFPEADVLIVGDHMPPFFPRAVRSRYDPAHVPWIYLRNRAALARAGGQQVAGR
jgi:hypothetical protein